jgi:hypothetical protein
MNDKMDKSHAEQTLEMWERAGMQADLEASAASFDGQRGRALGCPDDKMHCSTVCFASSGTPLPDVTIGIRLPGCNAVVGDRYRGS